jgi:hypothetical protein
LALTGRRCPHFWAPPRTASVEYDDEANVSRRHDDERDGVLTQIHERRDERQEREYPDAGAKGQPALLWRPVRRCRLPTHHSDPGLDLRMG